jgi:hypothetical protein
LFARYSRNTLFDFALVSAARRYDAFFCIAEDIQRKTSGRTGFKKSFPSSSAAVKS